MSPGGNSRLTTRYFDERLIASALSFLCDGPYTTPAFHVYFRFPHIADYVHKVPSVITLTFDVHTPTTTSHKYKQESRAAARKPRDAASVLFR